MRPIAILLLLAAASFAQQKARELDLVPRAQQPTDEQFIAQTLYPATALLYSQDESGSMKMTCTATAIEKTPKGYVFVTASHCACKDLEDKEYAKPEKAFFYITPDEPGEKQFLKASLVACGYQHKGDDFALFDVNTEKAFPVVAIGDDVTDHAGQPVVNIASPGGLGRQTFRGAVSAPKLDRSVESGDISWTGAMLLQLPGTNGGSSGSAIVCVNQRAICGFLVGVINETSIVAIPVSKYKAFRKAVDAKTYKNYHADE